MSIFENNRHGDPEPSKIPISSLNKHFPFTDDYNNEAKWPAPSEWFASQPAASNTIAIKRIELKNNDYSNHYTCTLVYSTLNDTDITNKSPLYPKSNATLQLPSDVTRFKVSIHQIIKDISKPNNFAKPYTYNSVFHIDEKDKTVYYFDIGGVKNGIVEVNVK